MRQINTVGEVNPFDSAQHSPETLARKGLLVVGLARASGFIYPGVQTTAPVDRNGRPALELTGMVYGEQNLYKAAGWVMQQLAYMHGLAPGHIGIHHTEPEVLASVAAKRLLKKQGENGDYVGYLGVVGANRFESVALALGNTAVTRQTSTTETVVGLTLADVNGLVGPKGIDGLRDTLDHPTVRQHLMHLGVRQTDDDLG